MNKKYNCLLLAVLAGNSYLVHSQNKYTNFSDTVFHIKEVVVSSNTKKQIKAFNLDVPAKYILISTNAIPSKLLEQKGIQDIQEAAKYLPGVRIQTSYGGFQQMSIRGFNSSVIMMDGIRDERSSIDNSYPFPDLSFVESIELLKGPASVLYGQSIVGGVVNVVRKSPEAKRSVDARLSYGSWNKKVATMGMGGKLAGPINYRGVVNFSDADGWRNTQNKRFSGYLALGGNLSEKDAIDVRGGFNRDFYGTEIGLPPNMSKDVYDANTEQLYLKSGEMQPGLNRKARYNNESDFLKNNGWNIMAQYSHQFNDNLKLSDKLAYTNDDINYFGTEELSYLESDDAIYKHYYMQNNKKRYICLDTVQLTFPLRFSHMAETLNNQLELSGKLHTGNVVHNYVGGYAAVAFWRNSFSGYNLGVDVQGPGLYSKVAVNDPHSMGYMTTSFSKVTVMRTYTHGLYLQDLVEFSDKLKVLLAGRYDFFNYQRASAVPKNGIREFDTPDDDAFDKVKTSAFTYRAGVVYLPIPDLSLYASVGSFFKPNRTFYSADNIYVDKNGKVYDAEKNGEVFKPEKGYQIELGSKYNLNEKLQVSANWYYIRKYNIVKTLVAKGGTYTDSNGNEVKSDKAIVGQVGTMDSKGFDVDITYTPVNGLDLIAGYGYTDARTRKLADNMYLSSESLVNKRSTYAPENTFYGYANYTFLKGFLTGLNFHASLTYMDKVVRNQTTGLAFPSYWLTDIGAAYKLHNGITILGNINNLFNKKYYNQSLGSQMVPSMPRNFEVSVSYKL